MVLDALEQAITKLQAEDRISAVGGGCLGMCGKGPNALVITGRSRVGYSHLKPSDAEEIIAAHAEGNKPVERLRKNRTVGGTKQ